MPLIEKIRASGSSTVLTKPIQQVEVYTRGDGDRVERTPVRHEENKIIKAKKLQGGAE